MGTGLDRGCLGAPIFGQFRGILVVRHGRPRSFTTPPGMFGGSKLVDWYRLHVEINSRSEN